MSHFTAPVERHMSSPVHTVEASLSLPEVHTALEAHRVSSVAVVEGGRLAGVITRTDLLRVGQRETGRRPGSPLLTFPEQPVSEVMTKEVVTVSPLTNLRMASQKMVDGHYHRLFVVDDDGKLAGVVSTRDVMTAVAEQRLRQPLTEYMSSPVFTIRAEEPVGMATERLGNAKVSGLVVLDDEWPVGVFTQVESLLSSAAPRDTPVEEVMSPSLVCMQQDTPLYRAAQQAAATSVRRVLALDKRRVTGIMTGLDFVRAAL